MNIVLTVGKLTVFNRFFEIFSLKIWLFFSPEIVERKKWSKSVSGNFKTKKKVSMTKPREGG